MNLIGYHFLTILSGKILLLTLIPGIKILRDSSACTKSSNCTPVTERLWLHKMPSFHNYRKSVKKKEK